MFLVLKIKKIVNYSLTIRGEGIDGVQGTECYRYPGKSMSEELGV